MEHLRLSILLLVSILSLNIAKGLKCQKGWEPIGCSNTWDCGKSMDEFDNDYDCIKAGGIPGVIACMTRNRVNVNNNVERFCIKDTRNGDIRFAKNAKPAIAKQKQKEKEIAEQNANDNV